MFTPSIGGCPTHLDTSGPTCALHSGVLRRVAQDMWVTWDQMDQLRERRRLRNPHGLPHLALANGIGTLLDDVQRGAYGVSSARRAVRPTAERRSRWGDNLIVDPYLRFARWSRGQAEGDEARGPA